MPEICSKCGLPKDLCVCQEIAKEGQKIRVMLEKKRFGKVSTVLEGFGEGLDLHKMTREFKQKLACGGTYKDNKIELQGDHRSQVKQLLMKMNYSEDQIDVC
ncbi:translation initiation factor [Candidatus Micrarchaeota archaeon]|nr:translation initiation factor [Candidatus Micrarchaeota archaeon]